MLGTQHAEQHGARKQGVGATRQTRLRGSGGAVALFHAQHDLLIRPNHQPDIEEHESTRQCAHPDCGHGHAKRADLVEEVCTCQEGEHGAPAEPPQCARRQFGHGVRFSARLGFLEILGLNKVEVVQHADPDDAGQHMEIAKEKLNIRHACVSRFL